MSSLISPKAMSALQSGVTTKRYIGPLIQALFTDEDAFAASLYLATLKVMDYEELSSYDAETIRLELQDRLQAKYLLRENLDQLMAMNAAISTDLFYTSLPAFIDICNILAGNPAPPGLFDPADPFEMAWAIAQIAMVDPVDEDEIQFSEEIRAYMGIMLNEHGFFSAPPILSMAIMPLTPSPAEITDDAELIPTIIENDQIRRQEVMDMIVENTRAFIKQIEPIVGSLREG